MLDITRSDHPSGKHILFQDDIHIYSVEEDPSVKFTSGTKFLHQFIPEFDSHNISLRYAAKHGMEQADVLAAWAEKGKVSRENGSEVHLFLENLFTGVHNEFNMENERVYAMQEVGLELWDYLNEKYEILEVEKVVAHLGLKLAGMVDLIGVDRETGDLCILDYKTSAKITFENQWQTMLPPCRHLQDCNFNHYTLQMNTYQWIMSEEGYYPSETQYERHILHIIPEGWKSFACPDRQEEIKNMVEAFKNS